MVKMYARNTRELWNTTTPEIQVRPITTVRDTATFNQRLTIATGVTQSLYSCHVQYLSGFLDDLFFFWWRRIIQMVIIKNPVFIWNEANVCNYDQSTIMITIPLTMIMIMTGTMNDQMKFVSYRNQQLHDSKV